MSEFNAEFNGKAYSYIRFSTPEQARGRSRERQREDCEKYCAERGLELATSEEYVFLDAGRSAYKGDHLAENGELARFVRLVKNGTIAPGSTLIVESLDRLDRDDVWNAVPRFMNLVKAGINVVTLKDGKVWKNGARAEDLILSIFIFARANDESSQKARRLKDVFNSKRKKAAASLKPMGDVAPRWLSLKEDGNGYEPIEEKVKAVNRIFDLTIAGYGKIAIARILNAEGHGPLTSDERVKGWGASAVSHVVKSRAVLGEWTPMTRTLDAKRKKRSPAGDPIQGYFPQVVSDEVFRRAQGAVESRRKHQSTKQPHNFNVWSGVGKCIHCGSSMHMVNKGRLPKGRTYIDCSIGRKGLCEEHKLIRLDASEAVFALILGRLDSMALVKDSGAALSRRIEEIDGELLKRRQDREAYLDMARQSPRSPSIGGLLAEADEAIASLEAQRDTAIGDLAAEKAIGFDTFMQRLDLVSYEGRNRANSLLKRLDVLVFIGRAGFVVSQAGHMKFGAEVVAGDAQYRDVSPWPKHQPKDSDPLHVAATKALKHMGPPYAARPSQAGVYAFEREHDWDQARQDAQEDEGTPLTDSEAEALLSAVASAESEGLPG